VEKCIGTILLMVCSWLTAYDQINRTELNRPVKTVMSSVQHKIDAVKDSVVSSKNNLLRNAPVVPQAGESIHRRDTAAPAIVNESTEVTASVTDDEPTTFFLEHRDCKSVIKIPVYAYVYVPVKLEPAKAVQPEKLKRPPFLQVHGNVMYNVNYYSNIDTPYNEQNIYQHTIQTYLDITVKGQYPMRLYLTNRFSNSHLFRNFSDLNMNYNNTQFTQKIKTQVREKFLASLPSPTAPDSLKGELDVTIKKLRLLEGWIKNPALLQKMVEAREQALRNQGTGSKVQDTGYKLITGVKDSILARLDTTDINQQYNKKKQQADSLRNRITVLQQMVKTANHQSQESKNKVCRDIEEAKNPAKLKEIMEEHHIGDSILPKGYKTLMAIRSFGIGRSVVNYSELSAKNISVNGVQVEYNPSAYYAVAAGTVDYRFRDFIVKNSGQPKQYLTVLRYGRGVKDANNIIFTWFGGKRQLYNAGTVDSQQVRVPSSALMGFTIEGNYRLTDNITVTAEVAKSSYPVYARDSAGKASLSSQMLEMSNRHNEAYSLKADAFFPKTQTTVRGTFKRLGANFQSFSTFTDGSAQTAWSAGVQQLFFKRQLTVALSANTNDFSNPFIGSRYKSTTVFKSIQATWRRAKWPVVSVGYFPSSQITKLGDGQFIENLFYTLTGNVTHSYSYNELMMSSAIVYTQFYNRSSDSGFVYFNTKNLLLSHSVFWQQFTLQTNASGAFNQDYRLYTLEGKGLYNLNKYVMVGAGVKYNHQTVFNIEQLGYSAETTVQIPKFGQVQFSAEKGFIPGMNKQLVSNNTGRVTYFKTF
jgi:hypothetical protein